MLKDIPHKKVEDIAIAILKPTTMDEMWQVYLLNLKREPIRNVLVNSKGYGEIDGEERKTSVLRHYFEEVAARSAHLVEPIQTEVIDFTNEYWVSFSYQGHLYDKKYVFVRGSISEQLLTEVPLLGKAGIMIR